MNLLPYMLRPWLCEPLRLQHLAERAISMPCFTAAQIARANRKWKKAMRRDFPLLTGPERMVAFCVEANGSTHLAELEREYLDSPEVRQRTEAPRAIRAVKGKIGVIPIHGPTDQRMTSELMKTNGTPLDYVSTAFDSMMNNPGIGAVILHMDTPGGGTYGTQELADKIYNARGIKPIYAMVDSMMASAGFWIGSAASMIVCTPGGDVGSVGVYCMHVDQSGAMEKEGTRVTIISSEQAKIELAPTGPLTADAIANLQESVMATDGKFKAALARNRGVGIDVVRSSYGKGRVLSAEKALKAGMVDRLMTFQELLQRLAGTTETARGSMASTEVLRERLELEIETEGV